MLQRTQKHAACIRAAGRCQSAVATRSVRVVHGPHASCVWLRLVRSTRSFRGGWRSRRRNVPGGTNFRLIDRGRAGRDGFHRGGLDLADRARRARVGVMGVCHARPGRMLRESGRPGGRRERNGDALRQGRGAVRRVLGGCAGARLGRENQGRHEPGQNRYRPLFRARASVPLAVRSDPSEFHRLQTGTATLSNAARALLARRTASRGPPTGSRWQRVNVFRSRVTPW